MGRPFCKKPGHTTRRKDGRCLLCVKAAQARHYRKNSPAYKSRAASWSKKNPDKRRAIQRKSTYGFVPDRPCPEFCEICEKRKATCLDHDHVTNKFRGWLCVRCNSGLAAFGDNLAGVTTALIYLAKCS